MKKFLAIIFCLLLCLTPFMFFGCEEKLTNVGEVEASNVLAVAMENMEEAQAVKMYSEDFSGMGKFLMIASATENYTEFLGTKSWVKQEGDYWFDYSIATYEVDDEEVTDYIKSLVISEDGEDEDGNMLDMLLSEFEDSAFSGATKLKGEFSISFKVVEDGATTTMTFKVKDETLKSIEISAGMYSMSIGFEFGTSVVEEIPVIPTNVEWDIYEPYIEVDGIPTEFVVGDALDLTDVTLEFYEDTTSGWAEVFDLTIDMISGFDTTTVGTRTMTITFYGLTFEVEYTVVEEPVVE